MAEHPDEASGKDTTNAYRQRSLLVYTYYSALAGVAIVAVTLLVGQAASGLGTGPAVVVSAVALFAAIVGAVWVADPVVNWMCPRRSQRR